MLTGLDTNVLIRYMVQDDPAQSARGTRLIEGECTREAPGYINRVVLCEVVWVLSSAYGYRRDAIADAIEKILRIDRFRVEDLDAAWRALHTYRAGRGDFADYLLGGLNREAGCKHTVTFDKALAGAADFSVLR